MYITTPRYTIIEDNAIEKIETVLNKLNLKNPIIITGKTTKKYCKFNYDIEYYNEILTNNKIEQKKYSHYDCVIGVGGGKAIDVGKYLSYILKVPFISVPTTASNDGIASPIISIKQPSFMAEAPMAIIADTRIIKKSPKRLLSAGMGDIVSNITAVLDWKLAHKEKGEKYSESSAIFSKTIAKELITYVINSDLSDYADKLVKALVGSGIAIAIANSSRPASGSEHLFSHAIDKLKKEYDLNIKSLHGEQCGVGTIIMSYLHEKENKNLTGTCQIIKQALKKVKAPTTAKELKIDEDIIIEALTIAHKIRNRWTILRNGIDRKTAIEILEETEVI
ncbi:3-dehydroquinate synthase [Methanocaldococcus vulcanius M7]|uniref:Glycerol-1-phosphate dehydrogenase [NAD(P)+] n=1 Tax=Methanocaldococcus vulcanius (strain ATCC 700851 / DSM 12094 / M7) TaxID=579137 RepID=C9RDN0_METVM|nr:sn-glycerol-1-phosphate dehydrogenase [Methanocaldococcus vulcanius]ACX73409.1 3-dehydroquinate synthase [Methanocaldococcus vulcanius M7]